MKRYLFLLSIIIVAFASGDVSKERIVLDWDKSLFTNTENSGSFKLSFTDAEYVGDSAKIPVYFRVFNLNNNSSDMHFSIENCQFEAIKVPANFDYSQIEEEVQIKKDRLKSGGTTLAHLQIIPVKREGDKVFVLKGFELKKYTSNTKSAKKIAHNWKTESVLKQGNWVKISTNQKGIYKITYSKLKEWGFSNPANVSVFGSGGIFLSENPGTINYDDLPQSAVWHGKNNGADCLFFYAPGVVEWTLNPSTNLFEHRMNDYATKGFFFLSENATAPKLMKQLDRIEKEATHPVNSFDAYDVHENDLVNVLPLGSGKNWYGESFRNSSSQNINFDTKDIVNPTLLTVRIRGVARSFKPSELTVNVNQQKVGGVKFSNVNTSSQSSNFADLKTGLFTSEIQGEKAVVGLKYYADKADNIAVAWLDFVEVNYRRKLKYDNSPLFFRDATSIGSQNIAEFSIENGSADLKVYDITEWNEVRQVPVDLTGTQSKFKRPAQELREYVVFKDNGSFPEPEFVGEVKTQNLHGLKTPEFLIVSHRNFMGAANRLADFHRQYDGMSVEVVLDTDVYNEFSSGTKNATGIRNFIKMFYDRNNGLKYVLLFGNGSFDNKNVRPGTQNFIPTFQSENSLSPVESFVTDDYFVILDDGESVYNGAVDLGIGRIPATTLFEADLMVDKILKYYAPESHGDWRNALCFIGDDEDGNLHVSDSEKLTNQISATHNGFVIDKIYLDAYPRETTSNGKRYPDVTAAINQRVKEGVLVLNYVGHANTSYMADERVLDISHVNSWSNANNLPIFVTATCEFSRFDSDEKSIGEYVLFNAGGGGIGLFSTTRLVFAYSNYLLSRSFYSFVFETNEEGEKYRLGDIMRLSKINTINTINKRNFSLLADPALKLSYPKHKVITTSINGKDATASNDTMNALQRVDVKGMVADNDGNKLNGFSGEVSVTVFDKEVMMSTLGNGGETPFDFRVQENIIYKGMTEVKDGDFAFSFVVPKDISYALGQGKIMYYATDKKEDAHGAFDNFVIGGASSGTVVDNQGPEIRLFMDSENFVPGGKTSKNPTLLAFIKDENGINTVGTGIGHDITAVLDEDYSNVMVLNNYYKSDLNDYTSGKITYPFQNLAPGKHVLKLKAWDVANNSSEAEIEFEVTGEFVINEVSCYPNPASVFSFFTFEHNQSGSILDVVIEVFDQQGKRVDYIVQQVGSNGVKSNPVRWEINNTQVPVRSGLYIYRVSAKNNDGEIAFHSGKILVSR